MAAYGCFPALARLRTHLADAPHGPVQRQVAVYGCVQRRVLPAVAGQLPRGRRPSCRLGVRRRRQAGQAS